MSVKQEAGWVKGVRAWRWSQLCLNEAWRVASAARRKRRRDAREQMWHRVSDVHIQRNSQSINDDRKRRLVHSLGRVSRLLRATRLGSCRTIEHRGSKTSQKEPMGEDTPHRGYRRWGDSDQEPAVGKKCSPLHHHATQGSQSESWIYSSDSRMMLGSFEKSLGVPQNSFRFQAVPATGSLGHKRRMPKANWF